MLRLRDEERIVRESPVQPTRARREAAPGPPTGWRARSAVLALAAVVLAGCETPTAAGDPLTGAFTLRSDAFRDGGMLDRRFAADDPARGCGGSNVSPPLAWDHAPRDTRSFALLMLDPDGARGLGVSHWVAYGIPASIDGFAEGEVSAASPHYTGGKGLRGNSAYLGPCPTPGDRPHHYVFTLIALDLDPGALAPGLTRDEFLAAAKSHLLGAVSLIGRYAR